LRILLHYRFTVGAVYRCARELEVRAEKSEGPQTGAFDSARNAVAKARELLAVLKGDFRESWVVHDVLCKA
jgi:hypothetical protein